MTAEVQPVKINAVAYIHGDKDSAWDLGEAIGLTGDALKRFRHALTEFKLELEVDTQTGEARVLKIDDRRVEP